MLDKLKKARVYVKSKIRVSQEHILYVVEEISKTPAVPYGDTFQTIARYCISWKNQESCHLLVTGEIDWLKHPLVKGLIKGFAMKGLTDTAKAALEVVENGLSSKPKPITRKITTPSHDKQQKPKLISLQSKHLALLIFLIFSLLLLSIYNWYNIHTHIPTNQKCIPQFRIEEWVKSKDSDNIQRSNFVKYHFIDFTKKTINQNITYTNQTQASKFKKISNYLISSEQMATKLLKEWVLLNNIQESSIEALYQNWLLDSLFEINNTD